MRKLLIPVLALLVLVLALGTASANEALPAVGETVEGFVVKEIREFPLIDAQVVLFEHEKTGAQLMYIANDDVNHIFELAFRTQAIDNTGLPHVFEHATLDGSEKYPSKSLFFNLSYQTYNTYMNASTSLTYTCYPVGSFSEAQLLRLADFYTDSCFHPMLMTDESIFSEEAWRYRLMSEDGELTLEGTVYSEMLGATTLPRVAYLNSLGDAFPGSLIGNDHGGRPDDIPSMTWESVRNYHDLYYHPSNCIAYLYGDFEDYTAFLHLLDAEFSQYERREFTFTDEGYTPLTEPAVNVHSFAVETTSPVEHVSAVYYTFVIPGADEQQQTVLNTMSDLFIVESSALNQKIQTALPHASFSCYVETDGPDFALVFALSNADADDAIIFRELVDEAIADVAANGFPQELVDTTAASLQISIRLIRESYDVGVDTIVPGFLSYYISSGNPWGYMEYVDALNNLDDWNREGRYAQVAGEFLVGSQTTSLSLTVPAPGEKEAHDAALAEHLAEVKAAMSPEEITALVAASNAEDEDEDSSALVAGLQAVTVASLPEDVKVYEVRDEVSENGFRHVNALAGVSGIGQADILLDASHLAPEDLHYAKLLVSAVPYMHTSAHTREELAALRDRYLYSTNPRLSFLKEGEDGFHIYARFGWIAQDEDLATGYDLMYELIFDMDLDDPESMLAAVQALKPALRQSINSSPYNIQIYRGSGVFDPLMRTYNYTNFLDFYAFLEEAETQLTTDPEPFLAEMKRVRGLLANSTGAISLYAGSEEGMALNAPLADAFLAKLGTEAHEPASYESIPAPSAREGLVINSSVQYNAEIVDFKTLGIEYSGALDAVSSLVLDKYYYVNLRDKYGAYGVLHGFSEDLGMYVITYRDPNVQQSYDVIDQTADFVAGLAIDQEQLDGYILSAYNYYATPEGELSGAVSAAINYLEGRDPLEDKASMEALKALTPEKVQSYASLYATLSGKGVRSTSGAASVLEQNAALFDVVLNPFGTVDAAKVELQDVPEGHEKYEAVRFAFEEGLMAPAAEGVFGVDDPATAGDLACAVYLYATGEAAPSGQDAIDLLSQYGLVNPGDASDAVTRADAAASLNTLATMIGAPEPFEAEESEAFTRGDLAVMLKDFEDFLEALYGAE